MEKNYIGLGGNKTKVDENFSEYEIDENNFDYERYKKDITELNELTARILKNNPSCVKSFKLEPDCSTTEFDYSTGIRKNSLGQNYPGPIKKVRWGDEQDIWKLFDNSKMDYETQIDALKEAKEKKEILNKAINNTFPKPKPVNFFGNEWVGNKLSNDIIENSKLSISSGASEDLPPVAKDLKNLGLYGVYTISDNKFDATYMDFVESDNEEDIITDSIIKTPSDMNKQLSPNPFMKKYNDNQKSIDDYLKMEPTMKTLELKLFSSVGRMKEVHIPLSDTRIETGIKDYINDKFLVLVKELASKNIEDKFTNNIKKDLVVSDDNKDDYSRVCNRLTMVSNYIQMRGKLGRPTFILASKKNINYIIDAVSGYWWKDGKTYKYNKLTDNFNYNLIANDDMGDSVIMGRVPKEGEVGINLVINKNTLTNFEYSEDDITGINLSFDFFAFGNHPDWNYFSFDMKR